MGSIIAAPITVGLSLISASPTGFITFCKWLYSFFYIAVSRQFVKKRFDLYDVEVLHDPVKTGFLPPQLERDVESPQPDSHLLHAADEVFVYGVNSSSECLVVKIGRSVNHEAEAWIYMKLKNGKIYTLNVTSGYQNSCSDGGREFTCGGLKMHYNSPMRRWRIFYNGLLKETSEENQNSEKMVYVKFALQWRASSDLYDVTSDINTCALALGFANTKWKSCMPPVKRLNDVLNFYAQSGVVFGTISVDGESADHNLYLFGERVRFLGDTCLEHGAKFTHILGYISKNGSFVHIAEVEVPGIVKQLRFGFVVLPNGLLVPFSDAKPQLENISYEEKEEDTIAVFHAEDTEFKLKCNVTGKISDFKNKHGWDGSMTMDRVNIQLNGREGSGILIKGRILKTAVRSRLEMNLKEIPKEIPFVVHFSDDLCEVSEVTGGKGSSLGKLTQLNRKFQNFIVPNGIVVTTSAYEAFVSEGIKKEIRCLEGVLYGNIPGDLKEACQRVKDEVVKTSIPDAIFHAVVQSLQKTFGEALHTKKFAVRSSATGEDTEQMSAAGQMETFLGVTGLTEIMTSVKKCWASQFSFIAAQYKRQNGQIINSPMAVVIQEMVPCDVAGVLFTCDPLTGNPSLMSITANYGLGESVVSGSEEPDEIMLKRDAEDKLTIKEKTIGEKSHRIVMRDDEGTSLEEVPEKEKISVCMSDAMILRLGSIAVQIEKSYRSNRDIEWGFWNNNLYIFQSRPVTSGTGETDYEIDHETDTPLRIENEYFTKCNIGEVMPGAMPPLSFDTLHKYFSLTFWRKSIIKWQSFHPVYFPKGFAYMYKHMMFYVIDLLGQINEGKEILDASMIGMFGRILDDDEVYEAARERHAHSRTSFAVFLKFRMIRCLFLADSLLKEAQKFYSNYRIPVEKMKNSKYLFNALMRACDDLTQALVCHGLASRSSSVWNLMIINLLRKARGGFGPEVYRDFSQLLSSISGVESADVPCAMQSLAFHIGKEVNPEDFKTRDPEEIVQWLKTSPTEAGIKFRDFLVTHGHRCLKEFDLRTTTWADNPKLLIQLLQNLVGNVTEDASSKTLENFDQVLTSLDIPLNFTSRVLLKHLLLPQCRKAVQMREASKSLLIKQTDAWRKGYKYLGKLMVSEGRIPDEDILFFMYLEEIQELLSTRSPKIISRAMHRRRRYPELDRYIFPEIQKGFPKPIGRSKLLKESVNIENEMNEVYSKQLEYINIINANDTPIIVNDESFQMQGIPVSQGVAKGFVRVAVTLEEASHIKQGEILVTYSTDIGWTPYFPSLAGVVTELGGLISHGAVVSREYGLPCIAGLHGATMQFQTGDYVLLDGNRGILQKLAPPL